MKTIDSLHAEVADLRALLVQIAEPVAPSEVDGSLGCLWCCGEEWGGTPEPGDRLVHDADCLWLAIRREAQP